MSSPFNEEYRFGSAAWSDDQDIRAAGLLQPGGPQIGYLGNKPLYLDGDAPMITIGGAGSGKLRDLLGYVVCNTPGQRMMVLDPRGELGAISWHVHASGMNMPGSGIRCGCAVCLRIPAIRWIS